MAYIPKYPIFIREIGQKQSKCKGFNGLWGIVEKREQKETVRKSVRKSVRNIGHMHITKRASLPIEIWEWCLLYVGVLYI